MGGLRSYSLRTLAPGPAGSWEEERGLISVSALFRMSKLRLAEGLVGVSGVSIPIGNSEESKESPGSTWPKDLIALKPGETSWDVVLKKIKELSDSVEGEGEGRREEGRKRVSQSLLWWARNKTFCFLVLCQFPRSYFKALLCWG